MIVQDQVPFAFPQPSLPAPQPISFSYTPTNGTPLFTCERPLFSASPFADERLFARRSAFYSPIYDDDESEDSRSDDEQKPQEKVISSICCILLYTY